MRLLRSDSPEVARGIASTKAQASRHLPMLLLSLLPNLAILAAALVSLTISMWAAASICLPAFLAWNAWVLWRARSSRLNWVIKAHDARIYIRLFVGFGKAWKRIDVPDVIVLEPSETASISVRRIEVFLYGPRPRIIEWLMIEPTQAVGKSISDQIPSFLRDTTIPDLGERVYWANEEQHLAVGWKWCHPAARLSLQQIVRECPSIVIGTEQRSQLDLNGIWNGHREEPDEQQRRMLLDAKRLGFGCKCVDLLSFHRAMTRPQAAAYLEEIEREGTGTEQSAGCSACRF